MALSSVKRQTKYPLAGDVHLGGGDTGRVGGGMNMASYTEHYGLHQWAPEDDFLRTDFNTDFWKIDTALGGIVTTLTGKTEVAVAAYLGNGEETNRIELGFSPLAVIISNDGQLSGGVMGVRDGKERNITLTETGFVLQKNNTSIPNLSGVKYCCLVFREANV